jgi:hypothetical protein
MGVEYHQQPELLTTILEYSNFFFTALFALEMFLKIVADGFFGYLSDGFNLFDGGIVALRSDKINKFNSNFKASLKIIFPFKKERGKGYCTLNF